MGKHGVLVWDRIFEGRKAKSAAELARIGNAGTGGVGGVGGKRWWGGRARKLLAGRGVWGVGGKTLVIGQDRHLSAWGVQHLLIFPCWKAPPDDQGVPWAGG